MNYKLSLKVLQETDEWIMFYDGEIEVIIPKDRIANKEHFAVRPGYTVTVEIPDWLAYGKGLL